MKIFKFVDKEIFLIQIIFSIFYSLLVLYFHLISPKFINISKFNLIHFSLEEIQTEKEFYEILGFPETKSFQERQDEFLKQFKVKQISDFFLFLVFILQARIFYKLKEVKFLQFYFLLFSSILFFLFSIFQNEKVFYLLSDRNIGTNEIAIDSLKNINFYHSIFYIFNFINFAIPLWLIPKKYFYKMASILFVTSSFLILVSSRRIELIEYSYSFEKIGIFILLIQNYFYFKENS